MDAEHDRVRASTSSDVLDKLDREQLERVAALVGAPPRTITERLRELDREWDVERVLEANASSLTLLGVLLSVTHSRRWLLLAAVVPAFLLQHALQGWCPPLALLRRLGIRTRREIDAERTALKALRGDFADLPTGATGARDSARRAVQAAQSR